MKGFTAVCIGVGLGLALFGAMDLFIHTARPDLGVSDPSMSPHERFLAARARTARRFAPIVMAIGIAMLCVGLLLVLI